MITIKTYLDLFASNQCRLSFKNKIIDFTNNDVEKITLTYDMKFKLKLNRDLYPHNNGLFEIPGLFFPNMTSTIVFLTKFWNKPLDGKSL
jgi:hypothetical protein